MFSLNLNGCMQIDPEVVLDVMKNRRSIRQFESTPVPEIALQKLLEAARWCQSACNYQPWRLIVIRKREFITAIANAAPYGRFIAEAPLAIAVVANKVKSPHWYVHDTAMCAHQICLMAWAMGLGTCWIGSLDRNKAGKVLKLGASEFLTTVLPIGFPKKGITPSSSRKELSEMVTYLD